MAAGFLMRARSLLARCAIVVAAFLAVAPGIAPAQVPTAEQIELLRSLSPEDRAALMQQLGIGGGEAATAGMDSRDRNPATTTVRPSAADLAQFDTALKADDTVLVDIDFIKAKPARIESQGAGLPPVQIPGEPAPTYEPQERLELQRLIDLVRARNPYQLDRSGMLQLPGLGPITLAGLSDEQATRRLSAEPALLKLDVRVARLPVRKQGVAGLKPYGYDLFNDSPSTFAPVTDVPVPSDYIVGAGDELMVQLYGSQNRSFRLTVGRDGRVNFPELGPISVAGKNFNAVRADLESRVSRQMIGVRASVSMGDTRSIRVFVLGEAIRPGSYTVSGLGSITTALYASGGIKPTGSLRDVQLKRQGAVIRRLDLYDLLLRGDTSNDAKLLQGDVIFIPPVGATVAIDGEVKRPAIYELRGDAQVADLVALAGGLTNEADNSRVAMVRVNENRQRVVVNVPLNTSDGRSQLLRNGDSLRVLRLRPTVDAGVSVEGHVFRPGLVAWREGLRLSDVIGSVDELKANADLGYGTGAPRAAARQACRRGVRGPCRCAARAGLAGRHPARAAGSHHRVRCRIQPPGRARPLASGFAPPGAARSADRGRRHRRAGARAGRLPARARHAHQRPAARGRQPAGCGVWWQGGADSLSNQWRRTQHGVARGGPRGRARRRCQRRSHTAAVRLPEHQGNTRVERAGERHARRRSAIPWHVPDTPGRDAEVRARPCGRADLSRVPVGCRVHTRRPAAARTGADRPPCRAPAK
ncbi:MAG: SLBB domain-containing protein [Steroidobacteraceae bacterium]